MPLFSPRETTDAFVLCALKRRENNIYTESLCFARRDSLSRVCAFSLSLSLSLLSSFKVRGFFCPSVVVKTVKNLIETPQMCGGESFCDLSHQPFSSSFSLQKYHQRERRETKGRTALPFETLLLFSFFLYQTRANHRTHKFIGKAESV